MKRSDLIQQLDDSSQVWDIIVIGGGATGLGIAVDAASRGYRTLLLEQADFAEGTSSRSTKLIHGGVRYLRNGEIGLVRDSLRERGRLMENAPHLVHRLPLVVPGYHWWEPPYYSIGLKLYDLLAGRLGIGGSHIVCPDDLLRRMPNLKRAKLRGGALYYDGQFDDARLAIALARTAVKYGACVLNHLGVVALDKTDGKVTGIVATDHLTGREYRARGRAIISATGVFSDATRRLDEPEAPPLIAPSQGIHLVVDRSFLGGETGLLVPATDDGRVLFAIPWHNRLLLGTTDTPGVAPTLHPKPLEEEISYLLQHAARYLEKPPQRSDIKAAFAGLRPLVKPAEGSGNTAAISRDHTILLSDSGLITIAGGKWTTYRHMAEDAVDHAAKVAGLSPAPCVTKNLKLDELSEALSLAKADLSLKKTIHPELPYSRADVLAAIRHEMPATLDDVLSRRTRCAILDEAASREIAPGVAALMAKELGKPGGWATEQVEDFTNKLTLPEPGA